MKVIRPITMYEVNGEKYPTKEKAIEACENEVADFVRQFFLDQELPMNKIIKATQYIIDKRIALVNVLNYESDEPKYGFDAEYGYNPDED